MDGEDDAYLADGGQGDDGDDDDEEGDDGDDEDGAACKPNK